MNWSAPKRVRDIVADVSAKTGVPIREIIARHGEPGARKPAALKARWQVIRCIAADTRGSTTRIGKAIGRDHTSVIYALTRMGIAYESDAPEAMGGRRTQAILRERRAAEKLERIARVERMKGWTPEALRRMREEAKA